MSTLLRILIVMALVAIVGCGSKSPTQPSTPTGTVGARIDSDCAGPKFGVTTVTVTVDGVVIGTAGPGGAATKVLPVGSHVISGRSQNGIAWGGDTWVTTASAPDRITLFACI